MLEKEAIKQITAVSSNDGDSDRCAESCIDRLTARECEKNVKNCKRTRPKTASYPSSSEGANECCLNGASARQIYLDLLKSLRGCLCHTLKSRGEPSCCVPSPRSSLDSARTTGVSGSGKRVTRRCSPKSTRAFFAKCASAGERFGILCCVTEEPIPNKMSTTEIKPSAPYYDLCWL